MLVGVREYRPEEVERLCSLPGDGLASNYSLLVSDDDATIVDATDTRARKIVNFDYYASSAQDLFSRAVAPFLHTVIPPSSTPQVAVVVDGTEVTRRHSLLDPNEGLLAQCWFFFRTDPDFLQLVDSVYMAAVELDDNNHLRDITSNASTEKEPTIIEDTDDHFTSVEDTSYIELRTAEDLEGLLNFVRRVYSPERHQVFSFILSYKYGTGLPNSTIQFLSLTVSELSRGMRSTRHCLTTAASLLESRSPSITFSGTKLTCLLKPVLLGKQPGLWIACFASASPSEVRRRETFKEAFCIAYTSSRIYSSRIGVSMCNALHRFVEPRRRPFVSHDIDEGAEIRPRTEIPHPIHSSPHQRSAAKIISPVSSQVARRQLVNTTPTSKGRPSGLVKTPPARRLLASERTQSTERRKSESSRRSHPLYDPCSSLESHPYNCSARYELETYKRVMEPAMDQLRRDMQSYAAQLDAARRELRVARRAEQSFKDEVQQLKSSLFDESQKRQELVKHYTDEVEALQAELQELRARSLSTPLPSSVDVPCPPQKQTETSGPRQDDSQNAQRSSTWIGVVDYHQRELDEHALRERTYRERIIYLEAALRERDAALSAICSGIAGRERDLKLESARAEQVGREREMERGLKATLESLRSEVAEAKRSAARAEDLVVAGRVELQRERSQRDATEAELRRLTVANASDKPREPDVTQEVVQVLRDGYERRLRQLEREVEAGRHRSPPATPCRSGSTHRSQVGMVSPAVDAPVSGGEPTTRLQMIAMGTDAGRFEDFMKRESSYTLLPPKSLEKLRP